MSVKTFRKVCWRLAALALCVPGLALANHNISTVTVNGGLTTSVAPGAPVTIGVSVYWNGNQTWRATAYAIATAAPAKSVPPYICVDSPNPDININGNPAPGVTSSFVVNAPLVPGVYNLYLTAAAAAACNGGHVFQPGNDFARVAAITVSTPGDIPPTAVDDTATVLEDAAATVINVLANDTDPDGGPKSVASVTQPPNGTVVNFGTHVTYQPNADYCNNGVPTDNFTYTLTPGSSTATVRVTVTCVDDPPVAVDDTATVTEDDPATPIDVLFNDTDIDGGPKSVASVTQPANGTVIITGGGSGLTYEPDPDYCNDGSPTDDFTYTLAPGGSTATVRVTVTCVNDAPVAVDNNYTHDEDTQLAGNVITDDTGEGVDSDADGDALSIDSYTDVSHGVLVLNPDGSFTYDPNLNYCGPDSFTYVITDDPPATPPPLTSNTATVSITVTCVNDPPVVTDVDPSAQTSDYSDYIGTVTITVEDVDDTFTTLSESNEPPLSAAGLALTSTGCTTVITESPDEDGSVCTWTYDGQVLDPGDNVHGIVFTPNDGEADGTTGTHTLTIQPEDATVMLDPDNPVAEEVETDGGNSGVFYMYFAAWETDDPDFPHDGTAEFGDLNEMVPYMTLVPVGPGGPVDGSCVFIDPLPDYPAEGYDQVALFECEFDDVPVNTYEVVAYVDGASDTTRYYAGFDEGVFVVFDPSLGFTTGGGWFIWPGTEDPDLLACGPDGYAGDRTNFGFNMKYNKKRKNVQGSLLLMRHTVDADCLEAGNYKVKSNMLDGLAIGEATDAAGNYGWAAFSGKATFREPGLDNEGNHTFLTYVEDHGDQGCGQDPVDEFWIEVRDKDGIVVLEVNGPDSDPAGDDGSDGDDEPIVCGNIFVPHTPNPSPGG